MVDLEKETKEFFERMGWQFSCGCWRKPNSLTREADTENVMSESEARQITKAMLTAKFQEAMTVASLGFVKSIYANKLEELKEVK